MIIVIIMLRFFLILLLTRGILEIRIFYLNILSELLGTITPEIVILIFSNRIRGVLYPVWLVEVIPLSATVFPYYIGKNCV